ncbi:structural protein [Arsukibacterium sp.]|uniref:structural protein n=1 Tax=Arsukibacterium sp. TaxID=1977258 RepID=UPI002FD92C91
MNRQALTALVIVGLIFAGVAMNRYNKSQPRGIRNNNPLNIRKSGTAWQGKVGNDGEFEIFNSAHDGIRAAARNLRTYANSHGLRTIAGIVSRWAPGAGRNADGSTYIQDTGGYIASVVRNTGIAADDILTATDYPAVIAAMIHHENGQQPYSIDDITRAVNDGFA